jgi:hypothetical protein
MLNHAKEVTRNGHYTYLVWVRYGDDLVILIMDTADGTGLSMRLGDASSRSWPSSMCNSITTRHNGRTLIRGSVLATWDSTSAGLKLSAGCGSRAPAHGAERERRFCNVSRRSSSGIAHNRLSRVIALINPILRAGGVNEWDTPAVVSGMSKIG